MDLNAEVEAPLAREINSNANEIMMTTNILKNIIIRIEV